MKTTLHRISSVIAALLLSLGMARAANPFDTICHDQDNSPESMEATANCTSSCPCPDDVEIF